MIDWQRNWKKIQRPLAAAVLSASVVGSLQGCIGLVVGGAVVGALSASDRRTFGAQTEDKTIVVKGELRIPKIVGSDGHVNVNSFNRKVLLTGEVKDEAMKEAVAREAAAIEGVQSVVNEIDIIGRSSFTSRSNDTFITTKVKASLIDNKDLYANAFNVTTERGVVFLMGRVSQHEGTLAAEIARGVNGVQKVVKIFEYISDDDLKQYLPKPASANAPVEQR